MGRGPRGPGRSFVTIPGPIGGWVHDSMTQIGVGPHIIIPFVKITLILTYINNHMIDNFCDLCVFLHVPTASATPPTSIGSMFCAASLTKAVSV